MAIDKLMIACRIEAVYKVVNSSQIYNSGLGHTGVTYIDGNTLVVIDLYRKLFNISTLDKPKYFVLLKSHTDTLMAIPVSTSPNLVDVPSHHIRALPIAYRQTDTLRIASHVVMLSEGEESMTIFIIDENALL